LCSTCVKGYYPDGALMCIMCPRARDYLIVLGIAVVGGSVLAYLWSLYGDVCV
jgi:hypothetical protein